MNDENVVDGEIVPSGLGHQLMPFDEMTDRLQRRREFISEQLKEGVDYGRVPGVPKPFMWKSGAEKLLELHGLLPQLSRVDSVEDRNTSPPYFEFTYRCDLLHVASGRVVHLGAEGSCNNRERQYFNDRDGTSRGDAWVQRNTIIKMSQKRAIVAAALMVTSLSCDFTQDEEAIEPKAPPRKVINQTPAAAPAPKPLAEDDDFPPWLGGPDPDEEASRETDAPAPPQQPQAPARRPANPDATCSIKQSKYIYRLCKQNEEEGTGPGVQEVMAQLQAAYGSHIKRFNDLTKGQASDVIEELTAGNA